jgi:hypothetical protein
MLTLSFSLKKNNNEKNTILDCGCLYYNNDDFMF